MSIASAGGGSNSHRSGEMFVIVGILIGPCPRCGHRVELPVEPPICHQTSCRGCGYVIREREPRKPAGRVGLIVGLLFFATIIAVCSGIGWNMRPQKVTTVTMGDGMTATIYAEGPFHYEPPGYLSIEVRRDGREIVPRFGFVGIGPERVPAKKFISWRCVSTEVVALTHGTDVQFMLDLRDGRTWPPARWTLYECKPELGTELLDRLHRCYRELSCKRLDEMIAFLEREKERKNSTSRREGSIGQSIRGEY